VEGKRRFLRWRQPHPLGLEHPIYALEDGEHGGHARLLVEVTQVAQALELAHGLL
jgi:hypothetical protein